MKLVYNYILLRFMPNRAAGEFANVGVVVNCPQLGYCDYRINFSHSKRVTDFFPSVSKRLFTEGCKSLRKILDHQVKSNQAGFFDMASRIQEGVFHFSQIQTSLGEREPQAFLDSLYETFVLGNLAESADSQEAMMEVEIRQILRKFDWGKRYRRKTFADKYGYRISIPFASDGKAAKPLYFNHEDVNAIIDKTTLWKDRLWRMRGELPPEMLIAYRQPDNPDNRVVCDDFIKEIKSDHSTYGNITAIQSCRADEIAKFMCIPDATLVGG